MLTEKIRAYDRLLNVCIKESMVELSSDAQVQLSECKSICLDLRSISCDKLRLWIVRVIWIFLVSVNVRWTWQHRNICTRVDQKRLLGATIGNN